MKLSVNLNECLAALQNLRFWLEFVAHPLQGIHRLECRVRTLQQLVFQKDQLLRESVVQAGEYHAQLQQKQEQLDNVRLVLARINKLAEEMLDEKKDLEKKLASRNDYARALNQAFDDKRAELEEALAKQEFYHRRCQEAESRLASFLRQENNKIEELEGVIRFYEMTYCKANAYAGQEHGVRQEANDGTGSSFTPRNMPLI